MPADGIIPNQAGKSTENIKEHFRARRVNLSWRVRGMVMAQNWSRECQAFICNYCCARMDESEVVIDHITPLAKGGSNEMDNLQVTCWRCNSIKGDQHHLDAEPALNAILDAEWRQS